MDSYARWVITRHPDYKVSSIGQPHRRGATGAAVSHVGEIVRPGVGRLVVDDAVACVWKTRATTTGEDPEGGQFN